LFRQRAKEHATCVDCDVGMLYINLSHYWILSALAFLLDFDLKLSHA